MVSLQIRIVLTIVLTAFVAQSCNGLWNLGVSYNDELKKIVVLRENLIHLYDINTKTFTEEPMDEDSVLISDDGKFLRSSGLCFKDIKSLKCEWSNTDEKLLERCAGSSSSSYDAYGRPVVKSGTFLPVYWDMKILLCSNYSHIKFGGIFSSQTSLQNTHGSRRYHRADGSSLPYKELSLNREKTMLSTVDPFLLQLPEKTVSIREVVFSSPGVSRDMLALQLCVEDESLSKGVHRVLKTEFIVCKKLEDIYVLECSVVSPKNQTSGCENVGILTPNEVVAVPGTNQAIFEVLRQHPAYGVLPENVVVVSTPVGDIAVTLSENAIPRFHHLEQCDAARRDPQTLLCKV